MCCRPQLEVFWAFTVLGDETGRIMNEEQTVTPRLAGLRDGQSACAQQLFHEVYDRLVQLARKRMGQQRPRWADEEDMALSAFHSFIDGAAEGRFPQLRDRDDLWEILVKITARKVKDYLKASNRLKRGGGQVRGESVFERPGNTSIGGIGKAAADPHGETPELVVVIAEECQKLLTQLGDPALAQIAVWKMEGHTDVEVARKLGCATRTVERKLQRVREKWNRDLPETDGD
jgi:DNA-directed RNA polymerase specialized sigma24 family protein